MLLRFTKMHGLGNDFVVIDTISQNIEVNAKLARHLADRNFGVGCDQVLVIARHSGGEADFNYRIFNADGSEVANCGNGARCFARFVQDQKLTDKDRIRVKTSAGFMELLVCADGQISVDMGVPELEPERIPFEAEEFQARYKLETSAGIFEVSAISMGNPHVVFLVDDVQTAAVEQLGAELQNHPRFPQQVNAGFMAVKSREEIDLRVYERGTGLTLACGSGACAAVAAGKLQGLLDSPVKVNMPGGSLTIEWPGKGQSVILTGPATTVFQGQIEI